MSEDLELGQVSEFFLAPPVRRKLPSDDPGDIPDFVPESASDFTLYVRDWVMIGIRRCACIDSEREVGGILLGSHYRRGSRTVVEVRSYLRLDSSSTGRFYFDFDASALLSIHNRREALDGSYLVGWFHSHVRIGDPFMSPQDLILHQLHFKQPWHVSCVVGGGEWSLPIGFWRMEGDQLIEVQEHYLQLTRADPIGEQTRRYFRSCVGEERPLQLLIERLVSLGIVHLDSLGSLQRLMSSLIAGTAETPHRGEVMGPFLFVLDLAFLIAEEPQALLEARGLANGLREVRFLEDSLLQIFHADSLQERISVRGNHCFTISPDSSQLYCCDFVANVIWRIPLEPERTLLDLSISATGVLWLLASEGVVIQIASASKDVLALGNSRGLVAPYRGFKIPSLSSEPLEIMAQGTELWVRTGKEVLVFSSEGDGVETSELVLSKTIRFDASSSALLHGADADGGALLIVNGGAVYKVDRDGRVTAKTSRKKGSRGLRIVAAVCCAAGLLARFEGDSGDETVLMNTASLEVIATFFDEGARDDAMRISSLAVDEIGRAFVKRGRKIFLLTESGSPEADWYVCWSGSARRRIL